MLFPLPRSPFRCVLRRSWLLRSYRSYVVVYSISLVSIVVVPNHMMSVNLLPGLVIASALQCTPHARIAGSGVEHWPPPGIPHITLAPPDFRVAFDFDFQPPHISTQPSPPHLHSIMNTTMKLTCSTSSNLRTRARRASNGTKFIAPSSPPTYKPVAFGTSPQARSFISQSVPP